MKNLIKNVGKTYSLQIVLALIAIPIGIIIGLIDTIFGKVLLMITSFRDLHPQYLIPFLPLAGIIIVFFYTRFGEKAVKV